MIAILTNGDECGNQGRNVNRGCCNAANNMNTGIYIMQNTIYRVGEGKGGGEADGEKLN